MEFKKAVKTKSWLRLAIDGVSGSGKTFSAIGIGIGMAEVLGGRVALIDSEHGSAALYADRFDFDTLNLTKFQIEDYIEALNAAAAAQYPVVIIDSTSHAWDALVERVERIASQKFSGNTFRAWGEGTPLQKKLIEAMLNYPGHVIVTCRSKTEYSVDKDEKGKTTVKKVGTAAVQRQGFEYEFTMSMTMDANHLGLVTKDRTSKFQDQFIEKPGKKLGKELIAWLNEGAPLPPPPPKTIEQQCHDEMVQIGNILTGKTENGAKIFTDAEYNKVKTALAEFPRNPPEARLAFISQLLNEQKSLLQQRLEFTGAADHEPPATDSQAAPQESAVNHVPAMYQEQELGEEKSRTAETEDDGFVDDIPWKEDAPPKKPSGKTAGESPAEGSLSEVFHDIVNSEVATANKELDIF
jgi:hypothetical protein